MDDLPVPVSRIEGACELLADRLLRAAMPTPDEGLAWLQHDPAQGSGSLRVADGSLYSGNAGIALALAAWSRLAGSEEVRKAASTALTGSATASGAGLFTGVAGMALVASELKRLGIETEAASERFSGELSSSLSSMKPDAFDLLDGAAGTLLALTALSEIGDLPPAGEAETGQLKNRVVAAGRTGRKGTSWRLSPERVCWDEIGLAHGTSGVALALLATGAAGLDVSAGEAVEGALAYTESWLTGGNAWPDLRQVSAARSALPAGLSFSPAWCTGGAGGAIALSGLTRLDDAARWSPYLSATLDSLEQAIRKPREDALSAPNTCLCHGLAGAVWSFDLATGGKRRDAVGPALEILSDEAMLAEAFPVFEGRHISAMENPEVMTGCAGILLFFCHLLGETGYSWIMDPGRLGRVETRTACPPSRIHS